MKSFSKIMGYIVLFRSGFQTSCKNSLLLSSKSYYRQLATVCVCGRSWEVCEAAYKTVSCPLSLEASIGQFQSFILSRAHITIITNQLKKRVSQHCTQPIHWYSLNAKSQEKKTRKKKRNSKTSKIRVKLEWKMNACYMKIHVLRSWTICCFIRLINFMSTTNDVYIFARWSSASRWCNGGGEGGQKLEASIEDKKNRDKRE